MQNKLITILGGCAIGFILAFANQKVWGGLEPCLRGMWVWRAQAQQILLDKNERATFFDFCQKPHGDPDKAITHIYLHVDPNRLQVSNPYLTGFLHDAHGFGLKVEYLCGSPEWATEIKRKNGQDRATLLLEFNKNLPAPQRFDGLHLDVEPYLLDDWDNNAGRYWRSYIDLLTHCRQQIIDYNSRFSPSISLACDIPRWFDTEERDKPASEPITSHRDVQKIVDYTVIMGYRDEANEIIADVREEILFARTIDKTVVIGVLVGVPQAGIPENTFLEEGRYYMEEQLDGVAQAFNQHPSFKGFAIHDYEDYKGLLLENGIPKSNPIAGITEKSAYLVYYGEWNPDRVNQAKRFDLVILHPKTNITADWIAEIKNGLDGKSATRDDVIVLGYLSLGEDDVRNPRTGDGLGPGGFASWYMDKVAPKGDPDKNGQWGSYYVDAGNKKWQMFIKDPPPSSDSPVGSDTILHTLGCDGLFLDTIDTASPWGRYSHTAGGMSFFIKTLRMLYPDKLLVGNRGLFYYSPYPKDGIDYTVWSPREYLNGVMFECYYTEWDWNQNKSLVSPCFPDNNKTELAQQINDAAAEPYGFTVLCLDYLSKNQPQYQRMLDVQIHEAIVLQKWTDYIGDILLDTLRTDVLDYLEK